eukprot:TRINITY_DN639_c0_g1_i1.p1 TRINITY_DN639_c0_g1~~TRINITY_DN639_c0_g1_i1.p1  ORF type:complete len:152 (+),score=34.10 TRINITY_DN639_c0_g1_i1:108-563(+)
MILPGFLATFLINTLVLWYGYRSFKAVESVEKDDDTQWLTFWLLFSIINFAETWTDFILSWLPLYYELKLAAILYLGHFGGAKNFYNSFVRPYLKASEAQIDQKIELLQNQAHVLTKKAEELAKQKAGEASRFVASNIMKTNSSLSSVSVE